MVALKLGLESALGKRRVSLGESGSFVRGKSEFPLWKVKEAEKRQFQGKQIIPKFLYI